MFMFPYVVDLQDVVMISLYHVYWPGFRKRVVL